MSSGYVIGIDGGGSKTAGVIVDRRGKVLGEGLSGPSNFQVIGLEPAVEALISCIQACLQRSGCHAREVRSVVAGLTGAGRDEDQNRVLEAFLAAGKPFGISPRVVIESDARIGLEGAFQGGPGIILISGTGSIAFGKTRDGKVLRVGGWGRLIGDEGSGNAIGREGLNSVAKELDGRGEKTRLTALLSDRFGLKDQESIIKGVYRNGFDVASVAPLVIEAAMQQDAEAGRILQRSANDLVRHVAVLADRMRGQDDGAPRERIPLAFIGRLLTAGDFYSNLVKRNVESTVDNVVVVEPQSSPAYGAALMALEILNH